MSEMVRKQIYIHKRHQLLLKQLSQERGVSEAEIVRQAIEHEAAAAPPRSLARDRAAWGEVLQFVEARRSLDTSGEPYQWNRKDAYQQRESRPARASGMNSS